MLFLAIPSSTLQSLKFNVWSYCTVKSMPSNLWRWWKWGFLHGKYMGKKYCKPPFSCAINRYRCWTTVSFASQTRKWKTLRESLWYSGQYMNIADRSSSPLYGIKQGLWKVGLPQFKLASTACLALVLTEVLQFQFLSLGSVLQVVPKAGTPPS